MLKPGLTIQNSCFTREFGAFTREFCTFTREIRAFTREFRTFTREFRAFTSEFDRYLEWKFLYNICETIAPIDFDRMLKDFITPLIPA
ncbi:hypothetical protein KEH51_03425 [[Brevibacterium] frigoritolerans]|uniref:Uncharacterized protein n=1 Tax=Peribacillus frigoritolerans TaxID=450367 RepID=A0A941FIL4_9BACI|nr:hypothetical protein [Peribacillus frigoritolerans]